MKVFKCTKNATGILLIATSFSLYLYLTLGLNYWALTLSVVAILCYFVLIQLSIHLDEKILTINWLTKNVAMYDIANCQLYAHKTSIYSIVIHKGKWLWPIHALDDQSILIETLFSKQTERVSAAEQNSRTFVQLVGLRLGILLSCLVMLVPVANYFELPNYTDLSEVNGKLTSTNVTKVLEIDLEGHSTIFFISPQAGVLKEYHGRLKPNEGVMISLLMKQNPVSPADKQMRVWEIRQNNQKVISFAEIKENWIDWNRFGFLILMGVCGVVYCHYKIKRIK